MKKLSYAIGVLTVSALAAFAVETGQPAPDFTATDIEGKTHKLSDYKGKTVVIESYNLDCPFVVNQYKNGAMQDLQADVTGNGGVWLVVNSVHSKHESYRKPDAAKSEFKKQKMKATAWLDDGSGEIGKLYGMRTTPHMYVINKDGVLVYQGAIDDKPDAKHDPAQARNYVREAVKSLRENKPVEVANTKPYGCGVKYAK